MRSMISAACVLLTACGYFPTSDGAPPPGQDDVHPDAMTLDAGRAVDAGAGSSSGGSCTTDADCGDDVCSALLQCAPANTLRTITLKWTVQNKTASVTSCNSAGFANFDLTLASDWFESANLRDLDPVPCSAGRAIIRNVPPVVRSLEVRIDGEYPTWFPIGTYLSIDTEYITCPL